MAQQEVPMLALNLVRILARCPQQPRIRARTLLTHLGLEAPFSERNDLVDASEARLECPVRFYF